MTTPCEDPGRAGESLGFRPGRPLTCCSRSRNARPVAPMPTGGRFCGFHPERDVPAEDSGPEETQERHRRQEGSLPEQGPLAPPRPRSKVQGEQWPPRPSHRTPAPAHLSCLSPGAASGIAQLDAEQRVRRNREGQVVTRDLVGISQRQS